jgi:hypothetical protein
VTWHRVAWRGHVDLKLGHGRKMDMGAAKLLKPAPKSFVVAATVGLGVRCRVSRRSA